MTEKRSSAPPYEPHWPSLYNPAMPAIRILPDLLDQPDRGRGSRRPARLGAQGIAGKQPGRGRHGHDRAACRGRHQADPGHRQRRRHRQRGAGARARPPRDQQDRLARRPRARGQPRFSRRSAGQHRRRFPPEPVEPRRGDTARLEGRERAAAPPVVAGARRSWRPARPSKCATCTSTHRRGASSCAAREPNSRTARKRSGRVALSRPDVRFTLTHNGRAQWHAAPAAREERIHAVLGDDVPRSGDRGRRSRSGGFRLHGLVARPTYSRAARDAQYFFVNGRLRARQAARARGARRPTTTCFITSAIPPTCCFSSSIRRWWTRTSTRPRSRCASAIRAAMHQFVFHALEKALAGTRAGADRPRRPAALDAPSRVAISQPASIWRQRTAQLDLTMRREPAAFLRDAVRNAVRRRWNRSARMPAPLPHADDAASPRLRAGAACRASTSWRRTRRAWWSSTCTPRTSASSTSSSRARSTMAASRRSRC